MTAKKPSPEDFERSLTKGHSSYNSRVGHWWDLQSNNKAHKRAYLNICNHLKKTLPSSKKNPKWIVDYACGNGAFMSVLAKAFPKSKIVGLDGSTLMLNKAKDKLAQSKTEAELVSPEDIFNKKLPRVRLAQTILPNFKIEPNKFDVAIFLFPNLTCAPKERKTYYKNGYNHKKDTRMGELLARFREMDPEDELEPGNPEAIFDDLMISRVISRNLRMLLKKGGYCLRSDYANAPRDELTDLTIWRTLFSEGAFDMEIKDESSELFFEFLGSQYNKSKVILDVYHQTADPSDKEGGFFSSIFKAK